MATVPFNQAKTSDQSPNLIRNSGFWFAQRQAPGTATTYSSTTGRAASADGWFLTNENASATYQRTDTLTAVETGLQGRYYANVLKITSTGKVQFSQLVESQHTAAVRTRNVRVQCKMKQLVASAPVIRLGLLQLNSSGTADTLPATFISAHGANGTDPTLGTNVAYIAPTTGFAPDNCTISGNALSCTLSASWQRFGGVFTVPSNCVNIIVMAWSNAQLVATNGFAIGEVYCGDTQNIQDFSPVDISTELERVQRNLWKTFDIDTNPVQNAGAGTGEYRYQAGTLGALGDFGYVPHPIRMRVAPVAITTYNPAAANAQVRDITAAADCSATATSTGTQTGFMVTDTGNASTAVGNKLGVHFLVDSDI